MRYNKKNMQILLTMLILMGVILVMTGLWAVDIGVSAMVNQGVTTNGWWIRDGCQQYHIGLWCIQIGITVMALSAIVSIVYLKEEKNDIERQTYN